MMNGDAEMIRRVLGGETNAFAGLIEKYESKVARLCGSILRERYTEDAVQEIFLKAYRSLPQFKSNSTFATWLYRIAYNHCLNVIRKLKADKSVSMDAILEKSAGSEWAGADSGNHFELRHTAQELLAHLTEEERSLLILREVEGLSYRELADTYEVSMEAVKSRIFRARQSLIAAAKLAGMGPAKKYPETK